MGVGIDKPWHKCLAEGINNRCTRGVDGYRGHCVDVVVFDKYIATLLQRCKPVEYDVGVSKMYIGHFLTLFRLDRPLPPWFSISKHPWNCCNRPVEPSLKM